MIISFQPLCPGHGHLPPDQVARSPDCLNFLSSCRFEQFCVHFVHKTRQDPQTEWALLEADAEQEAASCGHRQHESSAGACFAERWRHSGAFLQKFVCSACPSCSHRCLCADQAVSGDWQVSWKGLVLMSYWSLSQGTASNLCLPSHLVPFFFNSP